ncbi:MAG: Fur family transcriptional regulator [Alsobacter sp.]
MVRALTADADDDPRHADLARRGCPVSAVRSRLRASGLRPTRQRILLGWMLFAKGDRHVTAESLYDEAHKAKVGLSLATVYNTLRQFTEAGLLRQVLTSAGKAYFDTNTSDHHHFLIQGEDVMMDVPADEVQVSQLPEPPPGYVLDGVEVIVRLKRVGRR